MCTCSLERLGAINKHVHPQVAPICQISYASKFLINTLILPAGLQLLVFFTWALNSRAARKAKDQAQPTGKDTRKDVQSTDNTDSTEELELELKASKWGGKATRSRVTLRCCCFTNSCHDQTTTLPSS